MFDVPRWVTAALAGLWSVWLLLLGIGESRRIPGLGTDFGEAIQHLVAFAVLGALVAVSIEARRLSILVVLVSIGLVGEVIQLVIPDRSFDWLDLAMDAVGAALGVALATRLRNAGPKLGLVSVTVVLMAITPFAPPQVPNLDIVFDDDCVDPPPAADVTPGVVLDESDLRADTPFDITEPSMAAIRDELVATNEISVEAWFETDDLDQSGPARIVTMSDGFLNDEVNMHIGLVGDDVSVRLRTSCNLFNRVLAEDTVTTVDPHHVVFTWSAGVLSIWVDGVNAVEETLDWGDFTRWDPGYVTVVGDEVGGGRRFDGTVHSVTVWNAALSDDAIVDRSRDVPEPRGT